MFYTNNFWDSISKVSFTNYMLEIKGRIYNKEGVLCAESKGIYVLFNPEVAKKLNMMSAEALKDFEPTLKA